LSATVTGPGEITTTAAVNRVLMTDNGTQIKVFSDNGLVGSFLEGTPLTVQTSRPGSTNLITYALQGSDNQDADNATILNSSLNVDFGTGNGRLATVVLKTLPTSVVNLNVGDPANISNLGTFSNVQIATTSTRGNVGEAVVSGGLGLDANLSYVSSQGEGNHDFVALLSGTEDEGASATLQFTGGNGSNMVDINDTQQINTGASTNINLQFQSDSNHVGFIQVTYTGVLFGSLDVSADAGTGTNVIFLDFTLKQNSGGSLTAAATAGPGAANVTEIVHKDAADGPFVFATATAVGDGLKQGFFTIGDSATSVAVANSGFDTITPFN
jgi:hypothetical protein